MLSEAEIIFRLVLGAILGGVIGFERQVHGRQAGFRTQLIVCVASVLVMIVSEYYHHLSVMNPSYVRVDPGRIAAGAITGIGFIGAGAILKMGVTIQGLTTAACLWMVSAIGLAVGAGLYIAGTAASALTLFSLLVLRVIERRMSKLAFKFITITTDEGIAEEEIGSVFKAHDSRTVSTDYERDLLKGEITYNITISLKHDAPMKTILNELSSIKSVKKIAIKG
ncbi:MAG: MgtC/SapB family protein [Nitrospirae bacterium]|nr:MAG: MgtC/SapB family protein [Nitrospirota bacterium]